MCIPGWDVATGEFCKILLVPEVLWFCGSSNWVKICKSCEVPQILRVPANPVFLFVSCRIGCETNLSLGEFQVSAIRNLKYLANCFRYIYFAPGRLELSVSFFPRVRILWDCPFLRDCPYLLSQWCWMYSVCNNQLLWVYYCAPGGQLF